MHLTNTPQPRTLADYEDARATLKSHYEKVDGIRAVVEIGTIPYPGLSDMDFIAIVEPNRPIAVPPMSVFTKAQRFLISHRPFMLTTTTYHQLRYVDTWIRKIEPLFAHAGDYTMESLQVLTPEQHHWSSLRRILHWTHGFILVMLQARATDALNARTFLDNCIGIKYFYRELHHLGLAGEEDDPHIAFYVDLREMWFDRTEEENNVLMLDALKKGEESVSRLFSLIAKHWETTMPTSAPPKHTKPRNSYQRKFLREHPNAFVLDTGNVTYVYERDRKEIELKHEKFRRLCPPIDQNGLARSTVFLPLSLLSIHANYLWGSGPISQQFEQASFTDLAAIPLANHPFLKEFVAMTNQAKEEATTVTLKDFYETFGWSRPPVSWGQRIQRYYEQLLHSIARSPLGFLVVKTTYEGSL